MKPIYGLGQWPYMACTWAIYGSVHAYIWKPTAPTKPLRTRQRLRTLAISTIRQKLNRPKKTGLQD